MGYPEKDSSNGGEVRVLSGFFTEEDSTSLGKYDFNAEKYQLKQIQLANRMEDLTKVAFWGTKPKFAEYDYHLCKDNNPNKLIGSGTVVPGIPMYWFPVDGIAELKYRTVSSSRFDDSTLITSAPQSANTREHAGPAISQKKSQILSPLSGFCVLGSRFI